MKLSRLLPIAGHFAAARWRWAALRGEALTRYQDARARRMVAYAARRSPFYRAHWAGRDLRDWRTLPTVDKQAMMANFDAFNTRGVRLDAAMALALETERSRDFSPTLDGLTVGLSSGTSGHRGLFLVSPEEQSGWAGVILARALHRLARQRVAFFLRSNSNLYEQTDGTLIQLRYFDLMTPLEEALAALNAYRPDILVGPPSLLGLLAGALRSGRLRAAPRRLISVAEVLEPGDRESLEAAFNAPVGQIYQCTEGLLAVSCARGGLHIQEDLVALQFEPLDDGPDPRVSPIVTDLRRTAQPIIRYRLNDVLQLDPRRCACGSEFRLIRTIEGRCDDIFYFESADGGARPFFPDVIRRMILLASPHIEDYQAFQERLGHVRVHLAVPAGDSFDEAARAVRAGIAEAVAGYGCRSAGIVIEPGLAPIPPRAKRRRVQRLG
jgi:putative adenylate-forming enzyme